MEAHIDNHSTWIEETDPKVLKPLFDKMLEESGFGILNFMEHFFEPQGWTGLWLLAESHFAIHTFPEQNKTYIELSSCNRQMFEDFLSLLEIYNSKETVD